jgi:uncharacterized membrane protein YjgN (DUF898 family)
MAIGRIATGRTAYGTATAGGGAEPLALTWKQQSGLIGLSIVNFVLRILTLGIYHFWGKTEVRRRIWSAVRLNGEPLEYTGTGKELFLGFLVVLALVFLPIMLGVFAVTLAFGPNSPVTALFQILLYVALFFMVGVAIHKALRYRLSRTRWRGIRGGLEGSSWGFAWTHFWTALLVPLTLGWIMPWRATKLQRELSNDMRFGNRPFRFEARSGPLYGPFAILWIGSVFLFVAAGAIVGGLQFAAFSRLQPGSLEPGTVPPPDPTLVVVIVLVTVAVYILFGILMAWYSAAKINHFAAHTHFEGATFRGNATAGSLIWLVISNLLILMLTLGLLAPVAQARAARYMVDRLGIDGAVPLADIVQRAEDPMRRGEGLAQVFDVDAF